MATTVQSEPEVLTDEGVSPPPGRPESVEPTPAAIHQADPADLSPVQLDLPSAPAVVPRPEDPADGYSAASEDRESEADYTLPTLSTIDLAARDVRLVLEEQREQSQTLTTKLNILFVSNGALLTSLSISRLMAIASVFSIAEVIGFLVSFTLLVRAFLPRQVAVSPNLEDRKFLEKYLAMSPEEYQLQMLVNLAETYNANKQRLDDVSQTLKYAAYATWVIAVVMLAHMVSIYFVN